MSIVSVEVHNFKKIKQAKFTPKGNSFVIIGDSGEGKTTVLDMISAHLMQKDYPSNPLTDGENEGFTETVHSINDVRYTIRRTYKRLEDKTVKLERFTVTSSDGKRMSLTQLISSVFNIGKFDYAKFFFECKSTEARYKYLVDSIGGDAVVKNNSTISQIEQERAVVGGQRLRMQMAWEADGIFSAETAERDIKYYEEAKTFDAAIEAKNAILANRKSSNESYEEYKKVYDANVNYDVVHNRKLFLEEKIIELKAQLEVREMELAAVFEESKLLIKDKELEEELYSKFIGVEEENKKISKEADEKYNELAGQISLFNSKRENFKQTIVSFRSWQNLDEEWNILDSKIKKLREENKFIFKSKLPIKELSIEVVNEKEVVMYNGREFCWDNLSKGETIKIAAQIQRALNPSGDNFIIIPEAQSLGSKLEEMIEECSKFNVQAIIEYTQRNEDFKIEFVEDFLNKH